MHRTVLAVILALALGAIRAAATDHPQDAVKLLLKAVSGGGNSKLVWVAKLPPPALPTTPG